MLQSQSLIVCSQSTSQSSCDSLKCFTYSEARRILTDLSRIPHLNNIIVSQDSMISNYVKLDSVRVDKIDLQATEINKQDRQIIKLKKRSKFFLIFAGLLGLSTQLIF